MEGIFYQLFFPFLSPTIDYTQMRPVSFRFYSAGNIRLQQTILPKEKSKISNAAQYVRYHTLMRFFAELG